MVVSSGRRAQSANNNTCEKKIHYDLPENEEIKEEEEEEEEEWKLFLQNAISVKTEKIKYFIEIYQIDPF